MQQPTATIAAALPYDRRSSGSIPPPFSGGADPRVGFANLYASGHPQQHQPFPPQASDPASNYQYTSARGHFDQQLSFQGPNAANIPSWFYNGAQDPPNQSVSEAELPYQLDAYSQHASSAAATPSNLAAPSMPSLPISRQDHAALSATSTAGFSKQDVLTPTNTTPFVVGPSGRVAPPAGPAAPHTLASAVHPSSSERRSSEQGAQHLATVANPLSEVGPSGGILPMHASVASAPESAGVKGSASPNSSARMSGSPEAINASQAYSAYSSASALPPGGALIGAPTSSSVLDSIESWLAPAPTPTLPVSAISSAAGVPTTAPVTGPTKVSLGGERNISPAEASATSSVPSSSSRHPGNNVFHPGSTSASSSAMASASFKTSIERRERNKASQRESRKRKQDRLETLEGENAALRKALADMKKFSHALSNGAGIRGEDGNEVAPIQVTKFTGAFHLDLIESYLNDDTAEDEWRGMIGHRFPTQTSSAQDWDDVTPAIPSSTSDSDDEAGREDSSAGAREEATVKAEGEAATMDSGRRSAEPPRSTTQQVKKASWELSLNQKRQKAAQSFPSMVAVPELVLYKVCRLYFSTLLPFTTKLKSGIINLRAAREAPAFIGGYDDLPRFPGDPSFGATDLYLPKNLMPTEMQMRIGFHPVEIAVLPYPAMRDRLLTILSAFHGLEELAQAEEDAARFSEHPGSDSTPSSNTDQDGYNTELTDDDIRKRTALVADMSAWKPKDYTSAVVIPDKSRVYSYTFLEKPRGSHRLRKPAQRWLDDFFYEVVQTLRVWSPAGDVFDGECFEFKESFFRKYPYMVDGDILRATNRWRRARGEDPIRL